jgi:hypothetical protein
MAKTIRITLSDEAEKQFNEIMYALPKNEDGSGICTQSQAINHALIELAEFEKFTDGQQPSFWVAQLSEPQPCGGCGNDDPAKLCIGCFHPFPLLKMTATGILQQMLDKHGGLIDTDAEGMKTILAAIDYAMGNQSI